MARHKEFDRKKVLEKAMEVFWQYGYEGTSIQTLLQAMGINRGSLYDTFGDKRSLFLEAIVHYETKVVQEAIAKLEAPNAGKAEIVEHFQNLVKHLSNSSPETGHERIRWGCFMTNVAVELCNHDPEAANYIRQSLQKVEQAFHHALHNAQVQGEISPDVDIIALAGFLTCMLQGLRVMVKVEPDAEALLKIVNTALSVLDPEH